MSSKRFISSICKLYIQPEKALYDDSVSRKEKKSSQFHTKIPFDMFHMYCFSLCM